jgi:uncharacterized protein (TIGR01777 family)
MRILVTGATGFIGRAIMEEFTHKGHQVVGLTRNADKARKTVGHDYEFLEWNDDSLLPALDVIKPIDVIINLAGENIAGKRWSSKQKDRIYRSRVGATEKIFKALRQYEMKPALFISASAIGIYGNSDEMMDENSRPAEDFLARVCKDWEEVVHKNRKVVGRYAILRLGMVLGKGGGAIEKMLPMFKLGLGSKLGDGKQSISWIHLTDLINMMETIMEDKGLKGIFNATAPFPVSNADFTNELARLLQKSTFIPAPSFMLKTVLGEMSVVLLGSNKVIAKRFKDMKFHYQYPTIEKALKEVVSSTRKA